MWTEKIEIDSSRDEKGLELLNSFTCYASSDIYDMLKDIQFVWVKLNEKNVKECLMLLKKTVTVKSNCVFLPFLNDKERFVHLQACDFVPELERIEISSQIDKEADQLLIQNCLGKMLQNLSSPIPLIEKSLVRMESLNFKVESTEPFQIGLWSRKTKTFLTFRGETTNHKTLLEFSFGLLQENVKKSILKNCQYLYGLSEIPSSVLSNLGLDFCSTVYGSAGCQFSSEFILLKASSGKSILLKFGQIHVQDAKPTQLFVAPSLLKYLRDFFEGDNGFLVLPVVPNPNIPWAPEVKISFVSTLTYHQLSTSEIDSLLSNYFEEAKYLFPNLIVEVPLMSYANKCEHLKGQNLGENSIFFCVLMPDNKTETPLVGYHVDKKHSNLYQKSCRQMHLHPQTVKQVGSSCQIVPFLPKCLKPLQDQIQGVLKCDNNLLLIGHQSDGKGEVLQSLSNLLGVAMMSFDCRSILSDSSGLTESKLKQCLGQALELSPCLVILKNVELLGYNREGDVDFRVLDCLGSEIRGLPEGIKLIGYSSQNKEDVFSEVVKLFDHHVVMTGFEDSASKIEAFNWAAQTNGLALSGDLDLDKMASKTSGFHFSDYNNFCRKAFLYSMDRLKSKFPVKTKDLFLNPIHFGPKVSWEDFEKALKEIQKLIGDIIGAPTIPEVKWEDVGGLEEAKEEIRDAIQVPLNNSDLINSSFQRSGLLLYGPPGVGKTLLAKAVATECGFHFLSVKGPELLNMYVGQSEQNVRDVFARAKAASPCIIFFDELDSLAPNRGKSGDSGGVMDRVVSQLLAELDEVNDSPGLVFIIGATNRPDLIDPSLLRPGRIDRLVYLGIAQDRREQEKILKSLTRKFNLSENFSFSYILDQIPKGLTGADMYAIAADANLIAISRKIRHIESSQDSSEEIVVTESDFEEALKTFTPSVTQSEVKYYESIKNTMKNQM